MHKFAPIVCLWRAGGILRVRSRMRRTRAAHGLNSRIPAQP